MGLWSFGTDGTINNGDNSILFVDLLKATQAQNSVIKEITITDLGEMIAHNEVVYMNQKDGKIYKAKYDPTSPSQKQNALGVFRVSGSKMFIVYHGLVNNFGVNLVPGSIYSLSNEYGKTTVNNYYKNVKIGRALNFTDIMVSIDGDISIVSQEEYNTSIVNADFKEGITLTDNSNTLTVKFNKLTYDVSVPSIVMFIRTGSTISKLDVATEYIGRDFVVEVGNAIYSGVFAIAEVYSSPVVLSMLGEEEEVINVPVPTVAITNFTVDTSAKTLTGTSTNAETLRIVIKNASNVVVYDNSITGNSVWTIPSGVLPIFAENVVYTVTVTATNSENETATTTASDSYVVEQELTPSISVGTFTVNPTNKQLSGTSANVVSVAISIKNASNVVVYSGTAIPSSGTWGITGSTLPNFVTDVVYTVTATGTNAEGTTAVATKTASYTESNGVTYNTSVTNGQTSNGISLTDPSDTATLNFDFRTIDISVPPSIMFATANGTLVKVDFATEYNTKPFSVVINGQTYSGTFVESSYDAPTVLS